MKKLYSIILMAILLLTACGTRPEEVQETMAPIPIRTEAPQTAEAPITPA